VGVGLRKYALIDNLALAWIQIIIMEGNKPCVRQNVQRTSSSLVRVRINDGCIEDKGKMTSGFFKKLPIIRGAISTMAISGLMAPLLSSQAFASISLPKDGAMGIIGSASELGRKTEAFHDNLLMPVITIITLFVLVLLIVVVVRYNKRANKNPANFSHNTFIEIIWTGVPVLILVVIGYFSLNLLKDFHTPPPADVVIKATGNQWYWTYDYSDHGVSDYQSRLHEDAADLAKAKAAKVPYLLEVDNRLVVPVNKVVHINVTASDVIHAFALPAFKIKADAVPGRLNHTWFKADREGIFYGQCSELCGKDHAYMPIAVEVVSQARFEEFIKKNGGSMPGVAEAVSTPVAEVTESIQAPDAQPASAATATPTATN
jgi:cytochrome c oxidase subunit 2